MHGTGGFLLIITHTANEYDGHTYTATIDGMIVGTARKGASPGSTHIADAWVEPSRRRQGIATALYATIERDLKITLTPNPYSLSSDAKAFWQNRQNSHNRAI